MPSPLARYLRRLHEIRSTGAATKETSFYAPLERLLNAAGQTLAPRVVATFQLKSIGAGNPDGGLFTADQLQRDTERPAEGTLPARGVVEVKGPGEALEPIVKGRQVAKYWRRYRQVLVTNYRQFAFVGEQEDLHGGAAPVVREHFALADSEDAFWALAADPSSAPDDLNGRFVDFLRRVLLYAAPIGEPQDVAWFLASYAREARARLDAADLERLGELREALEDALGLKFTGAKGDRFFRATIVQTLFYGLFSAWVLWHRSDESARTDFTWHGAGLYLRVPVIQVLFGHMAMAHRVRSLDLVDVLNRASAMLGRVDRTAFFARFDERDAIQYFYEPFLEAFDPQLRKELGVWYTPRPVVRYMVERVDRALREELGVTDGLADPNVMVLDPCCGTGAYLVAVLERIARTLSEQGGGALSGVELRRAAVERLFGFEILTAPFVVAHLQVGLFLREEGVPLGEDERAGVFLTNALTGWQPAEHPKLPFAELAEERAEADRVKQQKKILVVLGNPPYDRYAQVAVGEERDLSDAYRSTADGVPDPEGPGLNDLYVRFFRIAERQISEKTGRGIVCFITNYSWLTKSSYPGMREHFLKAFDRIEIDNLNGDSRDTGKLTPEGDPDPSIFSTDRNREGIRKGTAVALLTKTEQTAAPAVVRYRDLWGTGKREQLAAETEGQQEPTYEALDPAAELGYPFAPRVLGANYLSWPKLPELFPFSSPGIFTARDDALVDIDRDRLEARIAAYLDPSVSDAEIGRMAPRFMKSTRRFDPEDVRRYLLKREANKGRIIRYLYRPFDMRWLYWEPETKLLDEKRSDYMKHVLESNLWVAAVRQNRKAFDPPTATSLAASLHVIERGANFFSLRLNPDAPGGDLFSQPSNGSDAPLYNLSETARDYLAAVGADPEALFYHALAMLHAPAYRLENAGALRQDWPRVPLPAAREALNASAALGRRVAKLLDVEREVEGVTTGRIREALRPLGVPSHVEEKRQLDPAAGHFDVTAGWGYAGAHNATMPGRGDARERPFAEAERAALPEGFAERLGETTFDIYLNDAAYWKNVPQRVWTYTLGGYPVLKKWLSYREKALLGRALTSEEVRYLMGCVRRISALLLLEPELDASYAAARHSAATARNA